MQTTGSFVTVLPIQQQSAMLVNSARQVSVEATDILGSAAIQFFESGTGVRKHVSTADATMDPINGTDTVDENNIQANFDRLQVRVNMILDWMRQSGLMEY